MRLAYAVIGILVSLPSLAMAKQPTVAVLAVETSGLTSLDAATLVRMTEFLEGRFAASGEFELISGARGTDGTGPAPSTSGCDSPACRTDLGRALRVDLLVATRFLRLGDECTVNVSLFDVAHARTAGAASEDTDCGENGLVAALKRTVPQVIGSWRQASPLGRPGEAKAPQKSPVEIAVPNAADVPGPDGVEFQAGGATVLPTIGLTDTQWEALRREIGVKAAWTLAYGYRRVLGRYPTGGPDVDTFWDFAEARYARKRDSGRSAMIAGGALLGLSMIVGGALYGAGEGDGVESGRWGRSQDSDVYTSYKRTSGAWTMICGTIVSVVTFAAGTGTYLSGRNAMDALGRARGRTGFGGGASISWGGVAPIVDMRRATAGVAASFTF